MYGAHSIIRALSISRSQRSINASTPQHGQHNTRPRAVIDAVISTRPALGTAHACGRLHAAPPSHHSVGKY